MKTYTVHFDYHDEYCRGSNWSSSSYTGQFKSEREAIDKTIEFFELEDCEYRITKVEVVE